MFNPSFSHPEFILREPVRSWSTWGKLGIILKKSLWLVVILAWSLPFWPLYLFLRLFMKRPPFIASNARIFRCLRLIVTERAPQGPTFLTRVAFLLDVAQVLAGYGFWGFAWFVDEFIYGRQLRQTQIVEPLFEISAARSGSTQLAHYLEDDPLLCAPSSLKASFPFLWLWRIAPFFEPLLPRDWKDRLGHAVLPPEHHERHEMDPLRTDTFEMVFLLPFQFRNIFVSLSERVFLEESDFFRVNEVCREVWEDDFLRFIDVLGRKVLLEAGRKSKNGMPRLFIKGHFLNVAQRLSEKYPDARFLTMIRTPEKRIQSLANFTRCNPTVAPSLPVPWPWIVKYVCTHEVDYCEAEMDWYTRPQGPRRCVVRFDDYIKDLEGTMRRVYRECLDRDLSPHVPREHAPRTRTNYSVDRSFEEMGIDENALKERLAAYRKWCKSVAIVTEPRAKEATG